MYVVVHKGLMTSELHEHKDGWLFEVISALYRFFFQ